MPASARPAPDIRSNGDGSVTIKYVPTQSGVHELNVAYNEQPVTGQQPLCELNNQKTSLTNVAWELIPFSAL